MDLVEHNNDFQTFLTSRINFLFTLAEKFLNFIEDLYNNMFIAFQHC